MTLIELRGMLLWSLAINYSLLLLWFTAFAFGHDPLYQLAQPLVPAVGRDLRCLALRGHGAIQDRDIPAECDAAHSALCYQRLNPIMIKADGRLAAWR